MFLCLPTAMKVCQSLPNLLEIKKSVQAALGKLNPVHKRLQAPEAYQVCVGLCSSAEASWRIPHQLPTQFTCRFQLGSHAAVLTPVSLAEVPCKPGGCSKDAVRQFCTTLGGVRTDEHQPHSHHHGNGKMDELSHPILQHGTDALPLNYCSPCPPYDPLYFLFSLFLGCYDRKAAFASHHSSEKQPVNNLSCSEMSSISGPGAKSSMAATACASASPYVPSFS